VFDGRLCQFALESSPLLVGLAEPGGDDEGRGDAHLSRIRDRTDDVASRDAHHDQVHYLG
jgi:hypothetical protein